MAIVYDPTPVEWVALLVALTASSFAAMSFIYFAHSFHWKQWYLRIGIYHPAIFFPEVYTFLRTSCVVITGIAAFYVLKTAMEADLDTTTITNTDLLTSMILYIVFLSLTGSFGLIFFYIGLEMSWMGFVFLWELLTLGVSATMSYYFYIQTLTGGIIMIVVSAFFLYSAIVATLYWLYLKVDGIVHDPFRYTVNILSGTQIKTRTIFAEKRRQQTPSVHPQPSDAYVVAESYYEEEDFGVNLYKQI